MIRTKDQDGTPYLPPNEYGGVNDLASLVSFEILDPNAECNGKMASALIGYGDTRGLDCEDGGRNLFETLAVARHYFNYAIGRYFHLANIYLALTLGEDAAALKLMDGLIERMNFWMTDEEEPLEHHEWYADIASHLVVAATVGMPLTVEEARLVIEVYSRSAEHYTRWPYWDPWDASVPDGSFNYKPDRIGPENPSDLDSPRVTHVRPTEIGYLLEYCASPFRHPDSAPIVDCEIVADPTKWGE